MELKNAEVELLRLIEEVERHGESDIGLERLVVKAQRNFEQDQPQIIMSIRQLKRKQLVTFVQGSRVKITESGITALRIM